MTDTDNADATGDADGGSGGWELPSANPQRFEDPRIGITSGGVVSFYSETRVLIADALGIDDTNLHGRPFRVTINAAAAKLRIEFDVAEAEATHHFSKAGSTLRRPLKDCGIDPEAIDGTTHLTFEFDPDSATMILDCGPLQS